jgi:hypothetical protein
MKRAPGFVPILALNEVSNSFSHSGSDGRDTGSCREIATGIPAAVGDGGAQIREQEREPDWDQGRHRDRNRTQVAQRIGIQKRKRRRPAEDCSPWLK